MQIAHKPSFSLFFFRHWIERGEEKTRVDDDLAVCFLSPHREKETPTACGSFLAT
jgi:hypothetical protein